MKTNWMKQELQALFLAEVNFSCRYFIYEEEEELCLT